MSDFTEGFSARHDSAAKALHQAFSVPGQGFAAVDPRTRAAGRGPVTFSPQSPNPRHFAPADPGSNPTEGWDPFDTRPQAGFTDPIENARADGYAEGLATGMAEAGAAAARDQALLAELAAALRADDRLDRERMARQLRQTVLFLVSKLVGETGIAPELLARRIVAAADMIADSTESALLRVHFDDVPLLEGKLPATVFAVGDVGVARGSFVLESASTIVEDGPELWLEQLAHAIESVAVPPAC